MKADLRLGRWEDVLADVRDVDLMLTDPPYSERTHKGHDAQHGGDGLTRRDVGYEAWTRRHVARFVELWQDRVRGWWVAMCDHVLAPAWEASLRDAGLYVFAPLPFVSPGSRCRMAGDGPSCWTTWVVVARPRREPYSRWGTLPGAYVMRPERGMARVGGKPLSLGMALVADYSRPGDLVCDPCAGGGTFLVAADRMGRRAVGAEQDRETYEAARSWLVEPYTGDLL